MPSVNNSNLDTTMSGTIIMNDNDRYCSGLVLLNQCSLVRDINEMRKRTM